MESQNHGMTDTMKTVYSPKTMFCVGYKKIQWKYAYQPLFTWHSHLKMGKLKTL